MSRKDFALQSVCAVAACAAASAFSAKGKPMKEIELEKLPYAEDALAPVISANTVSFHYGKHHAGYVKTLNGLIAGTKYAELPLVEIVRASSADGNAAVFNNAAQTWNHTFYWNTLAPAGKGGEPSVALSAAVTAAFGSLEACKVALAEAAVKRFGSGWAWLIAEGGKLAIVSTPNAETPIVRAGVTPLAVVDVWEHAYYLDWQNRRADHVKEVIGRLFSWKAISDRFAAV